jgi:transposase
MPRYRTAYPPEYRRQMIDLVRSGRTLEELAREFESNAQSISTWEKQAERDAGKRIDEPTSAENRIVVVSRAPRRSCRRAITTPSP